MRLAGSGGPGKTGCVLLPELGKPLTGNGSKAQRTTELQDDLRHVLIQEVAIVILAVFTLLVVTAFSFRMRKLRVRMVKEPA